MASIQEIRQKYPQYSDMSDQQLADALHQKFYADMPRDQFNQKIGLTSMSAGDQAWDIAKSGGIGLVKGAIGLAGGAADTNALNKKIGGIVGNKLGLSPETQSRFGQAYDLASRPFSLGGLGSVTPGSSTIQSAVEDRTGKFYDPQSRAGRYTETVASFLPSAVAGPGGAARKVGAAAVSGLASEAAGEAAQKYAPKLEPYARLAGGLAGGAPFGRWRTGETRLRPALLTDELFASGGAAYKELENMNAQLRPSSISKTMKDVSTDLNRRGLNSDNVPDTFKVLNKLTGLGGQKNVVDLVSGVRSVPTRTAVGTSELDQLRQELLAAAQNQVNKREAKAAWDVIGALDRYLAKIPASDVINGEPKRVAELFAQARGDWAAAKRLQLLQGHIDLGEHMAETTHSGMNVENKLRQAIGALVKPRPGKKTLAEQHGFSQREIEAMKEIKRGNWTRNTIRYWSNVLGGGGGIGQAGLAIGGAVAGAAGGYEAGDTLKGALLGGLAGLSGFGLRKLGGRIARQEAERAADLVGDRSPLGRSLGPATRLKPEERARLIAAGLLRADETNREHGPLRITVHPKPRDYGGPL